MRTLRLHADLPLATGLELDLPDQAAEHTVRVLRLRVGDAVVLFNGDGHDYEAVLIDAGKRSARVRVGSRKAVVNESPLDLRLAQGIARGDKMDLVVQKATELGVARIVPLHTERGEVRLHGTRGDKRLAHWRAVATSACEQCGRARIPEIAAPMALADWLAALVDDGSARLALLPDAGTGIGTLDPAPRSAWLAVGPEGGFGDADVAALRASGFRGARLGPRILRTETAGLAALAALQALYGDW